MTSGDISNNNSSKVSNPPRASFASALAQKPKPKPVASPATAPVSFKTDSPSSSSPISIASADQSSVVKFPSTSQAFAPPSLTKTSPVITIDGNKITNQSPSATAAVKVNTIKFGSFAAAAASLAQNENNLNVGSIPTLPSRTQSAPPRVIEQQKEKIVKSEEVVVVVKPVDSVEVSVALSPIQEDNHHVQPEQRTSSNYDPNYRPHRYQNQNNSNQQQRYYNPQHQHHQAQAQAQNQNQQYYTNNVPQYQIQYQSQQYNPQYQNNYRNPHHNYRPRPQYHQYQGGYYQSAQPAMTQVYYAPPQGHQGYYNRPPLQQQVPENMAAATAVHFQRPAPAFSTNVKPAIAPVVPADLPSFASTANSAYVVVEATSSVPATPVVPVFIKPTASKIKIVDPATGKELNFGSKPIVVTEPKSVEADKISETAEQSSNKVTIQESAPVAAASQPIKSVTPAIAKKISIVIKDPNSNKEINLEQVVARPIVKDDLAVEELTAAFSQSIKLDESEGDVSSHMPSEISASNVFEKDKEILANLNLDDDVLSSEDEDEYTDYSDEEELEEVFIPSTIQFNQSISYPEGFIPFKAPVDEKGHWLYSREFMAQFREKCTTTPGDLQERLSAAVEKAKAFANSDRINDPERANRREGGGRGGQRDDRKKRHHNESRGSNQTYTLDMNAVLKNRADNAWAPRSAEELSQVERIIREVKGLLNKLTLEKFHIISDKILALGIMSPDVLSGVIDCVFDKSVSEPGFASMYAELCYKIVVEELSGLKKTLPANVNPDSQFRRLLVERCQAEYKHKRAWSKKRLEKLLETSEISTPGESADSNEEAEVEAVAATVIKPVANVGELTEEDYFLIKLKRRVLGNMRFIGEIFKVGLIGEKIMHSIITELLSNVENPEEEEIECLCRLLMTVGAILDKPEAVNFWNQYIRRMNWLISQPGKLSSRVKFLVMDTLELREKKWKTGRAEEVPKMAPQIKERDHRDQRDHRGHRDQRDQRDQGISRQGNAPPVKFSSTSKQQQQAKAEEWNRSGSSKASPSASSTSQLNRAPSYRQPLTQQSPAQSPAGSIHSPSIGRFGVLSSDNDNDEEKGKTEVSEPVENKAIDVEKVKKIISLLDELVQMNNYQDIFEEICGLTDSAKISALSGLLNRAIDGGKKPALLAVIRVFTECPDLGRSVQLEACKKSFGMIDDLAVDVPSVYETSGQLYAALNLGLPEIFETLDECSDNIAKTRVILQTLSNSTSPEFKEMLLKDAREFVESNKKPVIENLMKKLQIEI